MACFAFPGAFRCVRLGKNFGKVESSLGSRSESFLSFGKSAGSQIEEFGGHR
jgi:hypothetical protein